MCSLGQLQAGDRVWAINGCRTDGLTLQQASKLIREGGDSVVMEIEFDVAGMCIVHDIVNSVLCHMMSCVMSHDIMCDVIQ